MRFDSLTAQSQLLSCKKGAEPLPDGRLNMTFAKWTLLLCVACTLCRAQDTQFLPEIDAHLKLNPNFRIFVQAKDDREGGDPQQFTFGPSIQLYLKPLLKLKEVS